MGPLEFLPEIEAFGLMGRLSKFVLREAVIPALFVASTHPKITPATKSSPRKITRFIASELSLLDVF
jgi:hypothetical protein